MKKESTHNRRKVKKEQPHNNTPENRGTQQQQQNPQEGTTTKAEPNVYNTSALGKKLTHLKGTNFMKPAMRINMTNFMRRNGWHTGNKQLPKERTREQQTFKDYEKTLAHITGAEYTFHRTVEIRGTEETNLQKQKNTIWTMREGSANLLIGRGEAIIGGKRDQTTDWTQTGIRAVTTSNTATMIFSSKEGDHEW